MEKKIKHLTNTNMGGIWTFAFFPHEASEMENFFFFFLLGNPTKAENKSEDLLHIPVTLKANKRKKKHCYKVIPPINIPLP